MDRRWIQESMGTAMGSALIREDRVFKETRFERER